MPELKPCPFCGGEAELEKRGMFEMTVFDVKCMDCRAIGCGGNTAEKAVAAWNKRASDWIPCSERMPENGQRVLIRSSSNRFFDVIYHSDIQYPNFTLKIFGHTYAWDYRDVISWKPLPYPPEENDA